MYRPPEDMRSGPGKEKNSRPSAPRPSLMSVIAALLSPFFRKAGNSVEKMAGRGQDIAQTWLTPLPERLSAARSDSLDPRLLDRLVHDPEAVVRLELAWNENVPEDVLYKLRHDADATVSGVARRRLIDKNVMV
ncbi:MAG: hypothetical protein AB7W16_28060 [Candidatus Obscuribacterales bacterium]